MQTEKSCGAVVFTCQQGEIWYLLVQNPHGVYGFPKGHMEGAETERETAIREIWEETGLQVNFLPGFRATDLYPSPVLQGQLKQVVYFLAEFARQEYRLQPSEISGGGLYAFPEAMDLLQFPGSRRILQEADNFLRAK